MGVEEATSRRTDDSEEPLDPALAAVIATQAPDGILVTDDDGKIEWTNTRLTSMLGYGPGALVGSSVEVLLPDELRSPHVAHRASYASAPKVRPMGAGLELQALAASGEVVPVEIALAPVPTASGLRVVAVVRDITDRISAEASLWSAEEALAIAEERERIARDLHDTVIQQLFATGLALQAAAAKTTDTEVAEQLGVAVDDLDATIRQVRNAIFELHAPTPGESLRHDVLDLARNASRVLGFDPRVNFEGPVDTTTDEAARTALLASLQEALSNTARHAAASRVLVGVEAGDSLRLKVKDNGCGFDPAEASGWGLSNMKDRASDLGGSCEVRSSPGAGTTVEWQVPIDR